jgi:hypothetical protein
MESDWTLRMCGAAKIDLLNAETAAICQSRRW